MEDFTYICQVDGAELLDSEFPTHEQVLDGLNAEVCVNHQ